MALTGCPETAGSPTRPVTAAVTYGSAVHNDEQMPTGSMTDRAAGFAPAASSASLRPGGAGRWHGLPTAVSPLSPGAHAIEAPDATPGTVGGMSSLTIRTVEGAPFFRGSVEGGGEAEQI